MNKFMVLIFVNGKRVTSFRINKREQMLFVVHLVENPCSRRP